MLQTINLDGSDNRSQVSTACGRPWFSIARLVTSLAFAHLVGHLIGRQWGSLFHVHMFLLFTSKVLQRKSNIFFVDQPTSPMPYCAADVVVEYNLIHLAFTPTNAYRPRWNRCL